MYKQKKLTCHTSSRCGCGSQQSPISLHRHIWSVWDWCMVTIRHSHIKYK